MSVVGRQGSKEKILQCASDCCIPSFARKHRDEECHCAKTVVLLMGRWVGWWQKGCGAFTLAMDVVIVKS